MELFLGRSPRAHVAVWLVVLFLLTGGAQASGLDQSTQSGIFLLMMALFIPIGMRRLTDLGQSRWWLLLLLVPLVNIALLLGLLVRPSRASDDEGNGFEATRLDANTAGSIRAPGSKAAGGFRAWTWAVLALLLLSLVASLLGPWSPDGLRLLILGRVIAAALVVGLVWVGFRLFKQQGNGWVAWGLCSVMVAIGSGIQDTREMAQLKVMAEELQSTMALGQKTPGATVPLEAKARGDFGKIELALKETLNQGSLDRAAYRQAVKASGLPTLLAPERVARDVTGEEGAQILIKANAALNTYRSADLGRPDALAERVNRLDLNPNLKRMVQSKVVEAIRSASVELNRAWTKEEMFIAHLNSALVSLHENRPSWELAGTQLAFTTPGAQREFDQKLSVIVRAAEQDEREGGEISMRHAELLKSIRP